MQLRRAPFIAVCLTLLLVGVNVRSVRAQAIHEGKLTGTVTSEDGAPLPGATRGDLEPRADRRQAIDHHVGEGNVRVPQPAAGQVPADRVATRFKTIVRENIDVTAASI